MHHHRTYVHVLEVQVVIYPHSFHGRHLPFYERGGPGSGGIKGGWLIEARSFSVSGFVDVWPVQFFARSIKSGHFGQVAPGVRAPAAGLIHAGRGDGGHRTGCPRQGAQVILPRTIYDRQRRSWRSEEGFQGLLLRITP